MLVRCSLLSTLINVANSRKLSLLDVLGQLKDKECVIGGMPYNKFSALKDTGLNSLQHLIIPSPYLLT